MKQLEEEFDKRFIPEDDFGLGLENLRIQGRRSEMLDFIQSQLSQQRLSLIEEIRKWVKDEADVRCDCIAVEELFALLDKLGGKER